MSTASQRVVVLNHRPVVVYSSRVLDCHSKSTERLRHNVHGFCSYFILSFGRIYRTHTLYKENIRRHSIRNFQDRYVRWRLSRFSLNCDHLLFPIFLGLFPVIYIVDHSNLQTVIPTHVRTSHVVCAPTTAISRYRRLTHPTSVISPTDTTSLILSHHIKLILYLAPL